MTALFQVRVTGILLKEDSILLVKQRVSSDRDWSLPGGRVEKNETLDTAMAREMREETGLDTAIEKLLYVCENPQSDPPLLHITFLLRATGGKVSLPTNEFDENPISDVRFFPLEILPSLGFSEKFLRLVREDFPASGSYMGYKQNIGL